MKILIASSPADGRDPGDAELATARKMNALMRKPEFWAEMAGRVHPKTRHVTSWFPGDVSPLRAGFYERYFPHLTELNYWDGARWLEDGKAAFVADFGGTFSPPWRGVVCPPSKSKIPPSVIPPIGFWAKDIVEAWLRSCPSSALVKGSHSNSANEERT